MVMSHGGMMWGYTQRDSGTDNSRRPTAGDKLDAIFEIGYPDVFSGLTPGIAINTTINPTQRLSISGLAKVYCNILFGGPPAANLASGFPGSPGFAWLDFTNCVYTFRGRLVAKLVKLSAQSW